MLENIIIVNNITKEDTLNNILNDNVYKKLWRIILYPNHKKLKLSYYVYGGDERWEI